MHPFSIELGKDEITRRLALATPELQPPEYEEIARIAAGTPRPAAVLIPFLWFEDGWHILFTRRNNDLAEHSGQVAFPGGRADPQDSTPEETALREAQEEIGLKPGDVQVLGRLRSSITITNYLVTPVVGLVPWPYPFRLQTSEVSRAFTIPLNWLADPNNHEERRSALPPPLPEVQVIYFAPYDGEVLWGASARITLTLLETLLAPDFPTIKEHL
jgi:8-oxo-dGTP pyrophosphatase MutT (NUDIX family)